MRPGVVAAVVTAPVPEAELAASMSKSGQRLSSADPGDLHRRARDCRERARAVVKESIAVPDAVRLSRRLIRDLCDLVGMEEVADVAQLLAGEIVTNVVLHTRTPLLRVTAEVQGGTLRVSVSDRDPELPTVRRPSEREPTGRGMMLVNSLAKEWGVAQRPGGKLVWFTLSGSNGPGVSP
jgi:anti-sigma regulatory factor (Ser/Thr protein kinase)